MDSNSNPITNANPGMPAIPSSPAPAPVVPTPSDAMPTIPTPVDNTVPPEPATSSVPTFSSNNPAANAAPVVPTTSSTPTSFGYNSGIDANVAAANKKESFDPSSVASFFTPETPSYSNGGIIAATEPITEPDPIPEPDPEELELNAPFQAAAPVPGSIGSAVSVPKDAPIPSAEEKPKKGGLFGKKSAPVPAPAPEPTPAPTTPEMDLNSTSPSLSSETIVNPNNPFLAQNAAPAPAPAPEPTSTPTPEMVPVAPAPSVAAPAPVAEPAPITPVAEAPVEPVMAAPQDAMMQQAPMMQDANVAMQNPMMMQQDPTMMGMAPAPEIPQFDPNSPLPMPGDPMMQPAPDMPFAFDSANNQMNPFAEAAALNADPNAIVAGAPEKAKNNKKMLIIGGAAAAAVLLIVLLVVMMGGGSKKPVANNPDTPTPDPVPVTPTSGTTVCKKKFTDERLASFGGAEDGTTNVTIEYKDDEIRNITLFETLNFDNETNRKSGLRTLKDEYANDLEKYSIADETLMDTEFVKDTLSITGTRKLASLSSVDAGIIKLFGIISSDGSYLAEDTIASYEDKGFTCTEKGSDVEDDDEINEEPEDEGPEYTTEDISEEEEDLTVEDEDIFEF